MPPPRRPSHENSCSRICTSNSYLVSIYFMKHCRELFAALKGSFRLNCLDLLTIRNVLTTFLLVDRGLSHSLVSFLQRNADPFELQSQTFGNFPVLFSHQNENFVGYLVSNWDLLRPIRSSRVILRDKLSLTDLARSWVLE